MAHYEYWRDRKGRGKGNLRMGDKLRYLFLGEVAHAEAFTSPSCKKPSLLKVP